MVSGEKQKLFSNLNLHLLPLISTQTRNGAMPSIQMTSKKKLTYFMGRGKYHCIVDLLFTRWIQLLCYVEIVDWFYLFDWIQTRKMVCQAYSDTSFYVLI